MDRFSVDVPACGSFAQHRRAAIFLLSLTMPAPFLSGSCCSPGAVRARCTEAQHNRWLAACAAALLTAERREHPPPTPWDVLTPGHFESAAPIADHFVAACQRLMRESWRLPPRDRIRLAEAGWPPVQRTCCDARHLQWLRACEADVRTIEGATRRALLAVFAEQGGLSTRSQRDYVHLRCVALKVRVSFLVVGDRSSPTESPEDVVSQASPYIDPSLVAD